MKRILITLLAVATIGAGLLGGLAAGRGVGAQGESRYFPETKHWVRGLFLRYWNEHGGLAQQGFPLTEEFQEQSALDGQTRTVQYFERAVFERHPENAGTAFEVLLAQLGKYQLDGRYPNGSNPAAAPVGGDTPPSSGGGGGGNGGGGNGLTGQEQGVVDAVNARRQAQGLAAFQVDPALIAAARAHSADIGPAHACKHEGSDGSDPWARIRAAGYGGFGRGEVVGCGYRDAPGLVAAWWQSDGHRAVLTSAEATQIGCGWWTAPDGGGWQTCDTGSR